MQIKKTNILPSFTNEDEERDFWASHSILDFPDRFVRVAVDFSKLKPSTTPVTVRLPNMLLDELRMIANKRDVPYQSLLKIFLADRVRQELRAQQ